MFDAFDAFSDRFQLEGASQPYHTLDIAKSPVSSTMSRTNR